MGWGRRALPRDPRGLAPNSLRAPQSGRRGFTCLWAWRCVRRTLFEYLTSPLVHKTNKGDLRAGAVTACRRCAEPADRGWTALTGGGKTQRSRESPPPRAAHLSVGMRRGRPGWCGGPSLTPPAPSPPFEVARRRLLPREWGRFWPGVRGFGISCKVLTPHPAFLSSGTVCCCPPCLPPAPATGGLCHVATPPQDRPRAKGGLRLSDQRWRGTRGPEPRLVHWVTPSPARPHGPIPPSLTPVGAPWPAQPRPLAPRAAKGQGPAHGRVLRLPAH